MRQPLNDYDEHYDDGFELVGEQRLDEPPPAERRLSTLLISIVAMVIFAGGLWFAYYEGTRHASSASTSAGRVPLIRADQQPDKIKPEQPGGMQIPDQNVSIYNEKPGVAPIERLLPPPEKPMPRPAPEPQQAPAPAAAPPEASSPQQTPQIAAVPPAAVSARPAVPAEPPATPTRPSRKPASESSETAKTGPVQIRLASVRTPDAARTEWERLKHDNADLLGNLRGYAVRADLGDKGIFYRIEAGPFRDAAAAAHVCGELKQRGLGCILAR